MTSLTEPAGICQALSDSKIVLRRPARRVRLPVLLVLLSVVLLWLHPETTFGSPSDPHEDLHPEEILALVRYSNVAQDHELSGRLRNALGQRVAFRLTMKDGSLRFVFEDPSQVIQLDVEDTDCLLWEITDQKREAIAHSRYSQSIRKSDILYEDLAMRYLYWPNPTLEGEERVKTRRCWKLRIYNPRYLGPYHCVEIWVDQASGSMMKMQCYDYDGKMIKRCTVNSGHKLKNGTWVLKEMRIESFQPGEASPFTRSYLEIDKP
jgi:hypothetical protein